MLIVSYGGGTDSTALLGLLHQRGVRPDQITFADTGDEKPHTYEFVKLVSEWCKRVGFPEIEIVRWVDREGRTRILSQDCINQKTLPSAAFGFKGCSTKYKIQPQERRDREDPRCKAIWSCGERVVKMIGYEAGEERRMRPADDKYEYQYPLITAGMDRDDCIEMIQRYMKLPRPGKSSCYFCPQQKKQEWVQLKREYPALFAKAVQIEQNAELTSVKGLGRRYSITEIDESALPAYEQDYDLPCGCVD
jgi:hypothetical protein